MSLQLGNLETEQLNPATAQIDSIPTLEMLELINDADSQVSGAVKAVLPEIARAVDMIAAAFQSGGRMVYVGAGTSGRLGVLDASECPPTFGVPADMVVGLIAGGDGALRNPIEGAEDDAGAGRRDLEAIRFGGQDILVGIAASGRTPYVMGALRYAAEIGAATVALACVTGAAISSLARVAIEVPVGPEVIGGSTRMKAGTAQKMVLNMLSTGSMIRTGKVYHNLMIDVMATNEKLTERALRIIGQVAGTGRDEAQRALEEAGQNVKLAVYILKTGCSAEQGRQALQRAQGRLKEALDAREGEKNA